VAPWIWFLIIGVFFFLMMRGGCGAHVMGHGHGSHGDEHPKPMAGGGQSLVAPGSVIDPVCGMKVDPASAKSSVYQGKPYFFCSTKHREAFEANPGQFLTKGSVPTTSGEQHVHG
jgi:YHS domain-containing protein